MSTLTRLPMARGSTRPAVTREGVTDGIRQERRGTERASDRGPDGRADTGMPALGGDLRAGPGHGRRGLWLHADRVALGHAGAGQDARTGTVRWRSAASAAR